MCWKYEYNEIMKIKNKNIYLLTRINENHFHKKKKSIKIYLPQKLLLKTVLPFSSYKGVVSQSCAIRDSRISDHVSFDT